ncbi:SCO7613 C-terminal domain-containing membrane protein [Blastococcus sp. SYSU D00922]
MNPQGVPWVPTCPVCGRPVGDIGAGPCPSCGLPAAAQSALVLARIGTTMAELSRERDQLLATLRASAPGAAPPVPAAPPAWVPPAPAPPSWHPSAPAPPAPAPPAAPRRRLSPQEVLLGLGALLVVAAAITFVAVAWTRFGLAFQAGVMVTVTAVACAASAMTARRGLRATEEALAAAGAALLAIDLGAARALGLFRLEEMSLRLWWAVSCAVVVVVALALGRLTRTTATWPLAALLAAQPLPFLFLTGELLTGPAGVAVALGTAAADLVAAARLRRSLAPVATVLATFLAVVGTLGGLATAWSGDAGDSWTASGVLVLAGAAALVIDHRRPVARFAELLPGTVGAVLGLSLAGSLATAGEQGWWVAAGLGLVALTVAVLTAPRTAPTAALVAGGGLLAGAHALLLAEDRRYGALALVALAATVPAVLAAVRLPLLRPPATALALLAPGCALLLARADGVLTATVAGLLLALLAAAAFAVATVRTGHPEEWTAAGAGALAGLAAGATSGAVGAWGQVAVQLGIAGVAAGAYAIVASRRWVGVVAVADLVVASWIAVGGAGIEAVEAYTLPAAVGLLVVALPQLRAGAPSWAAEGAAAGVALVPSALVVVADPTALRLVLVIAAAALLTVVGTVLHRQAPFVIGAGVLLLVAVGRLGPYAPLLPRWVTLGTAGLLLLVVGATYERRRQQAREAVAWVAQMR